MNDPVMQPPATTPALRRPDPQVRPGTLLAPSHDDIALRAYEIYNRNDRQQGQCRQNWQQAERELREQSETAGSPDGANPAPSPTGRVGASLAIQADAGTSTLWPGPHPVRFMRHAAIRMASGGRVEGASSAIRLTHPDWRG
jgi:hypothetical protein